MGRPRAGALLAAVLCCVPVGCTAPDTPPRSADTSRPAGPAPSPVPVLPAGVRYQEVTRHVGAGEPVRLYVLRVEPDARARVVAVHGDGMDRGDTVRSLARRAGALFAVNGTYFDVGRGGTGGGGDPIGLYAENGRVLSEALAGRPALLLGRDDGGLDARVTEVSTAGRMRAADGARRGIDGVNRTAGRVPGCGGTGGDRNATDGRPMTQPSRGVCTDADEVVLFTAQFGGRTPAGAAGSTELLLAADGTALRTRTPAGGPLPEGGGSLYGTGTGAGWLRAHVRPGTRPAVSVRITDPGGRRLTGAVYAALGGSARLLRDGEVDPDAQRLGPGREPRTVAGVTADGTLLLIAVDGRAPGESVGASPVEAARLARSLGAVEAVNLDGGGSTTAVLDGHVRNSPRGGEDAAVTERRVANAIAVLPE
ncbi:phosphodiester glycosidase family protein [Streptomyces sp. WAC08452]|uniref:phosphodiester glycosidase family protein n=1 Tax=Streptomyces sp. WAC08452 TaxID=2487414 RepID=UPI000FBACD6D|nr:phosphodiester glycosidase family protein [Streptomyces sp. WAC08452]RSS31613.1 phosphodiester glycosidase family protein [Streptomyces sp. WAC08452]